MGGNAFLTFIESGVPWWVVIIGGSISGGLLLVRSSLRHLGELAKDENLKDLILRLRTIDKLSSKELTDEQARIVLEKSTSEDQSKSDPRPLELKNKPQSKKRRRGGGRGKRGRPK